MDETTGATDLIDYVRTEFRARSLRELLHEPPTVLIGVDAEAGTALDLLEVRTVFDLAASSVFAAAVQITDSAEKAASALAQYGAPPSDLVHEDKTAGLGIGDLVTAGIEVLQGVPEASAAQIATGLGAANVRELALYPPYRAALAIVTALYFPENEPGFDPERPADLVPKTGEYPTERVQYTTLVMDEIPHDGDLIDVTGQAFRPLDLAAIGKIDSGFTKVAYGALLTFTQSWYAQGVTLGQLLHSTALAPGESTRIAVVDWSRRSRAGETEVIAEQDELTNDAEHNRAISEVTSAVASEAQGGFSQSNTNSTSKQSGTASAAEMSAPLGGLLGGPSGSVGHTSSSASSSAHADSYSTSWGQRDLASSMLQNVNDRTHQHAHSSRSRRASVVKEVSQSEHEKLSTRVIANYNHMHALTVQYYEVVQVHRVQSALAKADRVIFVPVALTDFGHDEVIRRFQEVLARAALSPRVRAEIRDMDVIELAPPSQTHFPALGGRVSVFARDLVGSPAFMSAVSTSHALAAAEAGAESVKAEESPATTELAVPDIALANLVYRNRSLLPVVEAVKSKLWSSEHVSHLAAMLGSQLLRADSPSLYLPNDLWVEGAQVEADGASLSVHFTTSGGASVTGVSSEQPLELATVASIRLAGSSSERDVTARVTLTLRRNGLRFPVQLPQVTVPKQHPGTIEVVGVRTGGVSENLKAHLRANRLYYSQAIYRSLTSTEIAALLSGYGVDVDGEQVPVSQVVDPVPVRYVGNFLAFKMTTPPDDAWRGWLERRGIRIGQMKEDLVPLGTGGTFAEAILGRSNCAEKLDITRFWNWQDSPIPLQPSDIAPLTAGSRATPEDVKPGQLSNPIINVTTPTSLPDPTGTAAVLAAIQNGSMFRDMSGLQGTIGLASSALQATAAGAATAGQQAGTNMNNLLKANTERQRIAAEMITSLAKTAASMYTGGLAGGGGGGISAGSHSEDGAKINYFDKTKGADTGSGGSGSTSGSGGAAAPVTGGGSSGGGEATGTSGGGSSAGSSSGGAGSYSQNPAALAATWGGTQPATTLLDKAMDHLSTALGEPAPGFGSSSGSKAWPFLDGQQVLGRLHTLAGDPNAFNQGGLGLCTAAAFFHHALQRKPAEFESFGKALYGGGIGFLGKLKVAPGWDLRHTDYAALAQANTGLPPQAEWMTMSGLRDSENWFFDFEGAPDEDVAMKTSMEEMSGWYGDTGFWTGVTTSEDTSDAAISALSKTGSNQLALWIRMPMIGDSRPGTHMITVEGPLTLDKATDTAQFDYWTWGQPVKTLKTTYSIFKANYLGSITAQV